MSNINILVYGDISNSNLFNSYSQLEENIFSDFSEWGKDKLDHFVEVIKDITKRHKNKTKSIEQQLKEHKVNVNKLRSLATKISKRHLFKIKKNAGSGFIEIVKDIGESINSSLNVLLPEENDMPRQVAVGVILLMFAIVFNTVVEITGILLFGPVAGSIIGGCLGAPISEELGKIVSIHQDAGDAYFIIFNAAEWSLYIRRALAMAAGGPTLAISILGRFICVGFHYALTKIHEAHSTDEKSREKGMKMGMMMHAIWNFFASFPVVGLIQMPIMLYMAKTKYDEQMKKNKK